MRARAQLPRGVVSWRRWRAGELLAAGVESNLVVDAAAVTFARVAAGLTTIDTVGFGTNGTAPSADDTDLTDAVTRPILGSAVPSAGTVEFAWRLAASDAPTMTVREVGLFDADGVLVARKTFSAPQSVEPGIELEGTWALTWS